MVSVLKNGFVSMFLIDEYFSPRMIVTTPPTFEITELSSKNHANLFYVLKIEGTYKILETYFYSNIKR